MYNVHCTIYMTYITTNYMVVVKVTFFFRIFNNTNSLMISSKLMDSKISFSIDIKDIALSFSSDRRFLKVSFMYLSFEKDRSSGTFVTNNDKKIRSIISMFGKTLCNSSLTIVEYIVA